MKTFSALAAAGLGAMTLAAAAPSLAATPAPAPVAQHATKAPVVGNLQHTPMQFWCSKGMPNYLIAVRTVKMPEKSVTFSEPQLHETHTMGPLTHAKPLFIFSTINQAGKTITITVKGNTSGSSFSETGTIPATCKGLPTIQPNGTVTPPTTKPTKPMPGKPAPTKPAPAKPGAPAGPKVDTDYVATNGQSDSMTAFALAGAAITAAAGATAIKRRR